MERQLRDSPQVPSLGLSRRLYVSLGELPLFVVKQEALRAAAAVLMPLPCQQPIAQGLSENAQDSLRPWARAITPRSSGRLSFTNGHPPKLGVRYLFGTWQPFLMKTLTPWLGFQASEAYLIKESSRHHEARQQKDGS